MFVLCVGTVIIALTLRSMPLVVGWIIVCVLIGCLLTQNKIKNARLAYINACRLKAPFPKGPNGVLAQISYARKLVGDIFKPSNMKQLVRRF